MTNKTPDKTSVNERAPEHSFNPTHWMPLPPAPSGPVLPPAPLPVWQEHQFRNLLAKLSEWRNDDHEDAITLCRSEIIAIIEGVKAVQNRTLTTEE